VAYTLLEIAFGSATWDVAIALVESVMLGLSG